jgi:outer membrane autotransporter protein
MTVQRMARSQWLRRAAIFAALLLVGDPAVAQQVVSGMVLPNGQVASGPVFRRNGTTVPSITTGVDANTYIFSTPPTLSFLPSGPAAMVLTSVPSLYVRGVTAGVTGVVGSFVAPSNTVRGLTAAQVRDVLALPYLPDTIAFVQVPAGTCVLYAPGAPIMGNFPAGPTYPPGPWGNGGALQASVVGPAASSNCQNPGFVPRENYKYLQLIGSGALAYRPNAGKGNTYAVAAALDVGAFPAQFSDMDTVYNSLDIMNNSSSPGALQIALKQLDGESYADFGYMSMMAGRLFLNVMHQQIRGARLGQPTSATSTMAQTAEAPLNLTESPPTPTEMATDLKRQMPSPGERRTETGGVWLSPYGAIGTVYGSAATHSLSYSLGGFAVGGDVRVAQDLVIGGALSYANAGISTSIPASGSNEAISLAAYASYSPGAWYVDGALGYAHYWGNLSRTIAFPGILRTAQGNPTANQFLGSVESGLGFSMNPRLTLTPFARVEVTAATQNAFTETGAGAINLNAAAQNTTGVRSILGMQFSGSVAIAEAQDLWLVLRLGWAHDYADLSGKLTANFVGKPDTSFTVLGPTPDRNAATIGASVNLPLKLGQAFINYDGNLSQSYSAHSLMLGLKVVF